MAKFVIDQAGLPAGTLDVSRTDGLDTGAVVTLDATGGGGGTFLFELLWVPLGDVAAEPTLAPTANPAIWTFTPSAGVYGTYRIRLTTDKGEDNEDSVTRVFVIRTPLQGLVIPALNTIADNEASLVKKGSAQVDASEDNSTDYAGALATLDYTGWWRALHELFIVAENSSVGGQNNTGDNVGSGADVFRDKVGLVLNFRGIAGLGDIAAAVNGDNVDVDGDALLPRDGARPMTGDLDFNGNETNAIRFNTIDAGVFGAQQDNFGPAGWDDAQVVGVGATGAGPPPDTVDFSGFVAPTATGEARKVFTNSRPASYVRVLHESASSSTVNRVLCPQNLPVLLRERESMVLDYDFSASRWRVAAHSGLGSPPATAFKRFAPAAIAAQQDDYGPTGWDTADHVVITLTGDQTMTGALAPTSGTARRFIFNSDTVDTLTLTHLDVASAAANRFRCPGGESVAVGPLETVELRYDFTDSVWVVASQAKTNVREVFFNGALYTHTEGDFQTARQGAGGGLRLTFSTPLDFKALVSLEVVVIPEFTEAAADIDLSSDYGAAGELFTANSSVDTAITYNLTINTLAELDISSVFPSLAAGDHCGIFLDHQGIGGNLHYLGVKMRYLA
jgi:hypothetical protein